MSELTLLLMYIEIFSRVFFELGSEILHTSHKCLMGHGAAQQQMLYDWCAESPSVGLRV